MNNGVFIPLEIMRREYISKLLLSVKLIQKGMPVIIGHKESVFDLALKTSEAGVLFYKAMMFENKKEILKKLKQKKFSVFAQDEEAGIIFENFKDFYRIRPSLELLDQLDCFFAWGKDDYNFLSETFCKDLIQNYGALRSCFWGDFGKRFYKNTIQNLEKKYGNYILIVTNFATYNTDLDKNESLKTHLNYRGFDLKKYKIRYENEKKIFFQYLEIIKHITKQTDKKIIIRPHPRENAQQWKHAVKGIKNTFIEKEGELIPLILGSELIIQNNCTSAIEAAASKIPVLTYIDSHEDLYCLSEGKINIPNKISLNIFGKEELINAIHNISFLWNKYETKKIREEILNGKLKDYGTTKAAENIAEYIIKHVGNPNFRGNQDIGSDSILFDIYEIFRILKYKLNFKNTLLGFNKRETLSYHKIRTDISNMLNIMKINTKAKVKRVARNTFYLYPLER